MNASDMNRPSETDWARVDAMTDDDIDVSDIPPLTQEQLDGMEVVMPGEFTAERRQRTVVLAADVADEFVSAEEVNAALRLVKRLRHLGEEAGLAVK